MFDVTVEHDCTLLTFIAPRLLARPRAVLASEVGIPGHVEARVAFVLGPVAVPERVEADDTVPDLGRSLRARSCEGGEEM